MSLTQRIVVAMLMGLLVGALLNFLSSGNILSAGLITWLDQYLVNGLFDTVGQIFVRSLKLLVVPLVFVSLVCGVASLGNNSRMGVVASKTVVLYMITTALAIALAVTVATLVQPGVGIDLAMATDFVAKEAPPLKTTIINMFPSNPVQSMADGSILQVIVFSLLTISHSSKCMRNTLPVFDQCVAISLSVVTLTSYLGISIERSVLTSAIQYSFPSFR